ncbi:MAG: hypothetical protein JW861_07560 [Bacteroidales bacterium]|nr:hypothetical protein [Bacteroidales bacterium]
MKTPGFQWILCLVITHTWMLQGEGARGQDDDSWWNKVHNWDGYTHWSSYIIPSPYYMGPNALPVPEHQKGRFADHAELEAGVAGHWHPGDRTYNPFLRLTVPLARQRVALSLDGVPVEIYRMDEKTVIERRTRNRSGKGTASGDLTISTLITLLRDKAPVDLLLGIHLRTSSGNRLSDARYTDAPAYFFDISFAGRPGPPESSRPVFRPFGMLGFYVWQTGLAENRQDDAFLFGIGAEISHREWNISGSLDGYAGYWGDDAVTVGSTVPVPFRDRPVVARVELSRMAGPWKFRAGLQKGIHDFQYLSLKCSATYRFLP